MSKQIANRLWQEDKVNVIISDGGKYMIEGDYKKLGLNADSSIEEVKQRYDLLIRRSIRDESIDIDGISAAYDRIIKENTTDYFDSDAELLHKKGFNKKKFKNFIFQRKILIGFIIWAVIGIFLLVYMLISPQAGNYTPDIAPF